MILGTVSRNETILTWAGEVVHDEWLRSDTIRSEVQLDEFVVMPNHFHAIVWIAGATSLSPLPRRANGPTPRSLSSLMAAFKIASTKRINKRSGSPGRPIWQRDYYDRVLRNERELERARQYIVDNPARWAEDVNNPASRHFKQ